MNKKIGATGSLLAVLSLLLAACGNNANSSDSASENANANVNANKNANASSNANTADASTDTNAASGADDESFTLKVGAWFLDDLPQSKDFMAAAEQKFKAKYPNAKIDWDILVGEKYFEKMKTGLASGDGDDVIFNQSVPDLAKAGYLADLSDQPWVANMLEATKPTESYQGKIYGVAQTVATFGVFYNKKIFADLGIQPPTTWSELMAASDKIKAAGITPMVGGFKDQWTLNYLMSGLAEITGQNPSLEADFYSGKAKVNGPELQGALDKLAEMASKGYFNKSALSIDWPQTQIEFGSGKAAMLYQGNWLPGVMAQVFKDKGLEPFEVGFFPLADDNGKALMGVGPDHSVSVNANSKHLQAAKDFVAVMLEQDVLSVNLQNVGLPGIKGINVTYDQPAMTDINNALQSQPSTLHQLLMGQFPQSALDAYARAAEKIIAGGKTDLTETSANYDKDKATLIMP
ncbi:ABC transporter substrate-binding protein [Paenibacillus sp. R14(2021)]|uniref:ABC transporter substrate-binding protein n=1 Tax=Paenibacillus sp. R14(2021) TaxID=2859228 RepID=UPI001C611D77|nr:extracellular solute-binding protein [Paenibacillus sp. R14(2021)]